MPRKNVNATSGGYIPRRAAQDAPDTFRQVWHNTVSATAGTAWETSAQSAALRTDGEGIPQRTERWYERAITLYREITAPAHLTLP